MSEWIVAVGRSKLVLIYVLSWNQIREEVKFVYINEEKHYKAGVKK